MIDWGRVIELRDEVGADEFDAVLELFIDEVEEVVMRLSKDDAARLERDLHFLKGSAWNLGFADFGALCQASEMAASRRDLAAVVIGDVVASYSTSKQMFMRDLAYALGTGETRGSAAG